MGSLGSFVHLKGLSSSRTCFAKSDVGSWFVLGPLIFEPDALMVEPDGGESDAVWPGDVVFDGGVCDSAWFNGALLPLVDA